MDDNNRLKELVSQLVRRVERMEQTMDETALGDVKRTVERISRAIDGEKENNVQGLTESVAGLRKDVAAMRLADVKREAKLDGMNVAVKVMAVATTGTALPQVVGFLTNLF